MFWASSIFYWLFAHQIFLNELTFTLNNCFLVVPTSKVPYLVIPPLNSIDFNME